MINLIFLMIGIVIGGFSSPIIGVIHSSFKYSKTLKEFMLINCPISIYLLMFGWDEEIQYKISTIEQDLEFAVIQKLPFKFKKSDIYIMKKYPEKEV